MALRTYAGPGPFDRIRNIHFSTARFQFGITRDDGWLYAEGDVEGLTVALRTNAGQLIWSGFTTDLGYEEAAAGLVRRFDYQDGRFNLVLDRAKLRDALGLTGADVRFRFTTDGPQTLETHYPRIYAGNGTPSLVSPGTLDITVPYWQVSSDRYYPDLNTTVERILVGTSIPYEGRYRIQKGNALGRFNLPVLGVEWRPNDTLTGWIGWVNIDNICPLGAVAIPWQYPEIDPPEAIPTHADEREYRLHDNVVLDIALSQCPENWQATAIAVETDFGWSGEIPFALASATGLNVDHSLGSLPPDLSGRFFVRTYRFLWDRSQFQYDTGEFPNVQEGLTAVLVQSPAVGFESFVTTPLPE